MNFELLDQESKHFTDCSSYWYKHSYDLTVAFNFEDPHSQASYSYILGNKYVKVFKEFMK